MSEGLSSNLRSRLVSAAARYQLWQPGLRLVVAASGGADSTALLHLLRGLAASEGLRLAVAHVDHGWRPESAADAAWVECLAAKAGLPFYVKRLTPPTAGNREQEARLQREAWFAELLAGGAGDAVATAHTRDDQAETLLLRLLRGAGPGGLAGIAPARGLKGGPGRLIRPALGLGRAELRTWLVEQKLEWREDASNLRLAQARNRLRHGVMPWLGLEFNPRLAEGLARLADLAWAEEAVWREQVAPIAVRLWQPRPQGGWRAPRAEMLGYPLALQRRLLRHGLALARGKEAGGQPGADYAACETLLEWLHAAAPRRRTLRRAGWLATVTPRSLEVSVAPPASAGTL